MHNESTTTLTTIVIADDHPLIRAGMASLLQSTGSFALVGQASDGEQAAELYQRLRPEVLLMDMSMPGCDGIKATQRIRQQHPQARIIILSAHEGDEVVHRAMRAGASGYLLKSAPFAELLDCIACVLAGRQYLAQGLSAKLAGRQYLAQGLSAKLAGRVHGSDLSTREQEILVHLATGMSNKLIARVAGIGVGTVKFHINNILAKLDAASRTEAVMLASRRGMLQLA